MVSDRSIGVSSSGVSPPATVLWVAGGRSLNILGKLEKVSFPSWSTEEVPVSLFFLLFEQEVPCCRVLLDREEVAHCADGLRARVEVKCCVLTVLCDGAGNNCVSRDS